MSETGKGLPSTDTFSRYRFWSDRHQLSPLGLRLKTWVERQYLAILADATRKDPISGRTSILEIGPGKGHFARVAMNAGFTYSGIEASPKVADILRESGVNARHASFPLEDPFPDQTFDVVYLSHVLEHCDTASDAVRMIQACHAKLKPGGIIMINSPNVMSHKSNFWVSDYTHNYVTTPLRARGLLRDCSFQVVHEERMVFGLRHFVPRRIVQACFALVPNWTFDLVERTLMPGSEGGGAVFGCENFTLVAKKT